MPVCRFEPGGKRVVLRVQQIEITAHVLPQGEGEAGLLDLVRIPHAVPPAAEMMYQPVEGFRHTARAPKAGEPDGAFDWRAGKDSYVRAGLSQGASEIIRPGLDAAADMTQARAGNSDVKRARYASLRHALLLRIGSLPSKQADEGLRMPP
jgi:hypothetical protein